MFHLGNDDLIAGLQVGTTKRGCHKVDGFGGPACEDDLLRGGRVDVLPHNLTRPLKFVGGLLTEAVHTAMDIAVDVQVVVVQCIYHNLRLLRGCGIV